MGGGTLDSHDIKGLQPGRISRRRAQQGPKLSPEETIEFRSCNGSIQWLAGQTRPDVAAGVSLANKGTETTIEKLKNLYKLMAYLKATDESGIVLEETLILSYGDCSWANARGLKSQEGIVVVLTIPSSLDGHGQCMMVDWKTTRTPRVVRSTIAGEAYAADDAIDRASLANAMLTEIITGDPILKTGPLLKHAHATDCRSLYDAVISANPNTEEERVLLTVRAIQEAIDVKLFRWVPTGYLAPAQVSYQWRGRYVPSTWGFCFAHRGEVLTPWCGIVVGVMPRRHVRDIQDDMKHISRQLRTASEASLGFEPTSFERRAQILRDLSGLCRRGMLRMSLSALEQGINKNLLSRIRESAQVQNLLSMAHGCNPEEREHLALTVLNELGLYDPHPVAPEQGAAKLSPRLPSEGLLETGSEDHSPLRNVSPEESHASPRRPEGGSKRPRSPPRPPGSGRHLPPPPAAPAGQSHQGGTAWDRPWEQIIKSAMSVKKGEGWISCKSCSKWFRRPSAFKQHLLVKQGIGGHPSGVIASKWNFDSLWDLDFDELVKEKSRSSTVRVREQAVAPKSGAPAASDLAARFADLQAMGVPAPPLPPAKRARTGAAEMSTTKWHLEQMAEEEISRSEFPMASEDAWVPFVDDISQRIVSGLASEDVSRTICCTFPQIEGSNSLKFKANLRWGVEDIISHFTAGLGLTFNDLGSRWCIRHVGNHTRGGVKTFVLEIFFSPGVDESNQLRSADPIPDTVRALLISLDAPEPVHTAFSVEGAHLSQGPQVARPGSESDRSNPISSHGTPAAAPATMDYEDVLVPDLLDEVTPSRPLQVVTPWELRHSTATDFNKACIKAHFFAELKATSELTCSDAKVRDKLERICSQILDQFQDDKFHVEAFVELGEDLRKFIAAVGIVPLERSLKLQGHLLLAKKGYVCHGDAEWPEVQENYKSLFHLMVSDVDETATIKVLIEDIVGYTPRFGDQSLEDGDRGDPPPAEAPLRDSEVTQRFDVTAPVASESLFHAAPDTSGRNTVHTEDSWPRPGAYMDCFALFVDGVAVDSFQRSGILGHAGFPYMCILCGVFSHDMDFLHEKPCCKKCIKCQPSRAEVQNSWRASGSATVEFTQAPWLGMSSPPRGKSADRPDIVIKEVRDEFKFSTIAECNIRSNVWVDLVRSFCLGSLFAFEFEDVCGRGKGVIIFDEWCRQFEFFPFQRFWIAGLTLWGSFKGSLVHFLHHPCRGTGIARQSPPSNGLVQQGRLLELFAGIGGWSTAMVDLDLATEVFAVDAASEPCETLAARHHVLYRTVQQFLRDATHQKFEVLQADIIDPSWWVATFLALALHGPFSLPHALVFLVQVGKRAYWLLKVNHYFEPLLFLLCSMFS